MLYGALSFLALGAFVSAETYHFGGPHAQGGRGRPPSNPSGVANPWTGKTMYANQMYFSEVMSTVQQYPQDQALISKVANYSTFYWIDSMSKIGNLSGVLQNAQKYQSAHGPVVVPIVVYDLPDRDCDAGASNGEIVCQDSQCAQGLATYEQQYIDPLVKLLAQYSSIQIVAVIEPDSLPNMATNLGNPKCQQAQYAYETGIAYAIKNLAALGNVAMYVDAAHGGWLGWPNNMQKFVQVVGPVLSNAGGSQLIRGFASNTANYQPLGCATCTADPCNLNNQGNPCNNEVKYIINLDQAMQSAGITGMAYITDTSRNGVTNERQNCADWCNINNSGLGNRPSTDTSSSGTSLIDAYVWVKVPGESDGTSDSSSDRYDPMCSSPDSKIPAPEAGDWYPAFADMLYHNAVPPL